MGVWQKRVVGTQKISPYYCSASSNSIKKYPSHCISPPQPACSALTKSLGLGTSAFNMSAGLGFLAMAGGISSFLSTLEVLFPISRRSCPRTLWICDTNLRGEGVGHKAQG